MAPKPDKLTGTVFARPVRKVYVPPRLIIYGKVRALTQAGSSGKAEVFGLSQKRMKP